MGEQKIVRPFPRRVRLCLLQAVIVYVSSLTGSAGAEDPLLAWKLELAGSFLFDICDKAEVGNLHRRALLEHARECQNESAEEEIQTDFARLEQDTRIEIETLDKSADRGQLRIWSGTMTCDAFLSRPSVVSGQERLEAWRTGKVGLDTLFSSCG